MGRDDLKYGSSLDNGNNEGAAVIDVAFNDQPENNAYNLNHHLIPRRTVHRMPRAFLAAYFVLGVLMIFLELIGIECAIHKVADCPPYFGQVLITVPLLLYIFMTVVVFCVWERVKHLNTVGTAQ